MGVMTSDLRYEKGAESQVNALLSNERTWLNWNSRVARITGYGTFIITYFQQAPYTKYLGALMVIAGTLIYCSVFFTFVIRGRAINYGGTAPFRDKSLPLTFGLVIFMMIGLNQYYNVTYIPTITVSVI